MLFVRSPWFLATGLWVLAVLSLITVGQRLREVHKQAGLASQFPA